VITRYCIIRNQTIISDGKIFFTEKGNDLNSFLINAYTFIKADYPKFYKMDNLSKLGWLAAEVLLKGSTLLKEYSSESIALVLSNAHSSLDTDVRYNESAKTLASPALFVYTLPNIVAGEICIRHKIKGENAFFISPAFDPELLVNYVTMILNTTPNAAIPNASMPNALVPNTQMPNTSTNACLSGWVDVMGEHHDVFLYLTEKNKPATHPHTVEQLKELYNTSLWNN
jgi:hypothetical protein